MILYLLLIIPYLVGWAISCRLLLQGRMKVTVCSQCTQRVCDYCGEYHYTSGHLRLIAPPRRPRGAIRPRNGGDIAIAASLALAWPVIAAGLLSALVAWRAGHGFVRGINALVPLTEPERERQAREVSADIDRLTKVVEGVIGNGTG